MSIHEDDSRLVGQTQPTEGAVIDAADRFFTKASAQGTTPEVGIHDSPAQEQETVALDEASTEMTPQPINYSARRGKVAGIAVGAIAFSAILVPQAFNGFMSMFGSSEPTPTPTPPAALYTQPTDIEGYVAAHRPVGCIETMQTLGATTLTRAAQVLDQRFKNGEGDGSLEAVRNVLGDQLTGAGLSQSDISQQTAESFEFEIPAPFCVVAADTAANTNPTGE